jgi:hypothetical protein
MGRSSRRFICGLPLYQPESIRVEGRLTKRNVGESLIVDLTAKRVELLARILEIGTE